MGGSLQSATLSRFDNSGTFTRVTNWTLSDYVSVLSARPIENGIGEIYNVEGNPPSLSYLVKRGPTGDLIWSRLVAATKQFTVGRDHYGGVHFADQNGALQRYDFDGNSVWTKTLPSVCNAMVLDSSGNRFLSMVDGTVARLGAEAVSAPVITNAPQGQTVLAGSNCTFTVGASGSGPLRYFWQFNGGPMPGQTNTSLNLTSVNTSQAGNYSVIVSNFVGSVTSAPALLRVKMLPYSLATRFSPMAHIPSPRGRR